ncbi:MAG: hypothetical protein J7604_25170 [Sporocytophaga sp.]|uniref:hypothetical protein n=1 Tax=Sporocytophaga sp. TaxID=2231183 RepID=UPI001AFE2711|nr:hypothetical protein [Sporocytophaga sp.]MBO9703524.1 hypothetical protein [Sporocytophaga sp.]
MEISIICFSKIYEDASTPKENLCEIMTCSEADVIAHLFPAENYLSLASTMIPKLSIAHHRMKDTVKDANRLQ